MKQTNNYKLNVWDKQDRIQMEDFNSDNAKVDAALTAVDAKVDTALAAVNARVDTKAEQSTVNAQRDEIVALTAAVALCGNCRVQVVNYTGNGNAQTITIRFSEKPLFFLVNGDEGVLLGDSLSNRTTCMHYDSMVHGAAIGSRPISWSGGTASVSIWDGVTDSLNKSGVTYRAMAFYKTAKA